MILVYIYGIWVQCTVHIINDSFWIKIIWKYLISLCFSYREQQRNPWFCLKFIPHQLVMETCHLLGIKPQWFSSMINIPKGRTIVMGQKGQCPPLYNFCIPLPPGNSPIPPPPGNFPIFPLLTICPVLFNMLSFHNHLETIVDIYKSTKSRNRYL